MRLASPFLLLLFVAACSSPARHAEHPATSGETPLKSKTQTKEASPVSANRWLSNSEILDGLDSATRAEVRFLLETATYYQFGPYGMNPPPREGTAFARIICSGDEELFLRLARAKNPATAVYGMAALDLLAPHRLKELLPELVQRSEMYHGIRDDLGWHSRVMGYSRLAISHVDFGIEKELLARTIEWWFARIDETGAGGEDLQLAGALIRRFSMQSLVSLNFAKPDTRPRLSVFQLNWDERDWSDEYWQEIQGRFAVDSIEWKTIVQLAVPTGRWEASERNCRFDPNLVGNRQLEGDDNRAVAARRDLEFLCQLLNPRFDPPYPAFNRPALCRKIRDEMSPWVLDAISQTEGIARKYLDQIVSFVRYWLREPTQPPQSAEQLVDLLVAQERGNITLLQSQLDDWLVQFPEALQLNLNRVRYQNDYWPFGFIYVSREDKHLPRWWLVTLERGTREAIECLLSSMSIYHESKEDAAADAEYVSRLKERLQSLAAGNDIRLKWRARIVLLDCSFGFEHQTDVDNAGQRVREIMRWLPELVADFSNDDLPIDAVTKICREVSWRAFNLVLEYADADGASQEDFDAHDVDPFWAAARDLYICDTKFNETRDVFSGELPLCELRKLERTPAQAWQDYQGRLASLHGLTPGAEPIKVKPGRERK